MSMKSVVIEGAFTIENVGDIQQQMRAVLAGPVNSHQIDVDLAAVTEFDGAGLQLLLAFSQIVLKLGSTIELRHPPEFVEAVLTQYAVLKRAVFEAAV